MSESTLVSVLQGLDTPGSINGSLFLPAIVSHACDDDAVSMTLDIQPDLHWLKGHFPGNPVLPGVVQLHWAVSIAMAHFGFAYPPREVLRLKFKHVVLPPRTIELSLSRAMLNEARFAYSGEGQRYSEGHLCFDATAQ